MRAMHAIIFNVALFVSSGFAVMDRHVSSRAERVVYAPIEWLVDHGQGPKRLVAHSLRVNGLDVPSRMSNRKSDSILGSFFPSSALVSQFFSKF